MEYYSQRNNHLYPNDSCGVSAYLNALVSAGWPESVLSSFKSEWASELPQLEDRICKWFMTSKAEGGSGIWDAKKSLVIAAGVDYPWQIHKLLFDGFCSIVDSLFPKAAGRVLSYYEAGKDLATIKRQLSDGSSAVVSSTVWQASNGSVLGHIVCLRHEGGVFRVVDSWGSMSDGYLSNVAVSTAVPDQMVFGVLKPLGGRNKLVHFVSKFHPYYL